MLERKSLMDPSQDAKFHYQGDELQIFAHAKNWKKYWTSRVAPFLKNDVLEVGAGIGANTELLRPLCQGRYLCLEPDAALSAELEENLRKNNLSAECRTGTVDSLPCEGMVDTAVYIDVLEHIENDAAELHSVARRVRAGGYVVVLSPAYQFLFSPFDQAIGHYRRYTRESLLRCTPPASSVVRIEYLDSIGGILSLGNRMFLRQSYPTLEQILFWDRRVVPVSRVADKLTGFRVGKSILAIWQIAG